MQQPVLEGGLVERFSKLVSIEDSLADRLKRVSGFHACPGCLVAAFHLKQLERVAAWVSTGSDCGPLNEGQGIHGSWGDLTLLRRLCQDVLRRMGAPRSGFRAIRDNILTSCWPARSPPASQPAASLHTSHRRPARGR